VAGSVVEGKDGRLEIKKNVEVGVSSMRNVVEVDEEN
jgi:hypothetical protein